MAIEIRNSKGELADLNPGTELSIDRYNPLFNDEGKIFQDITLPLKMPLSPTNLVFFGGGHLADAPNEKYSLSVQVFVDGFLFLAGVLEYTFDGDEFEALLLTNFASIRDKIKDTKLCDIYYAPTQNAITTALMYDTCENPKDYPFAFFPVQNKVFSDLPNQQYPYLNAWNHSLQNFVIDWFIASGETQDQNTTKESTHYKLNYVIKLVCNCLGFEAEGELFDDEEMNSIYIFTDVRAPGTVQALQVVIPPKLTIGEFLKILKTRFRIAFYFNVATGKVNVISQKTLFSNPESIDLSEHISYIKKLSPQETEGTIITLKPEEIDGLFKDPQNTDKFKATNQLVIGNGEKSVEINASTLKQTVVGNYAFPTTRIEKENMYLNSTTKSQVIRFLKFNGFKTLTDNKKFPQADPIELSQEDINWYVFLNDSKSVQLIATFPQALLSNFDLSKKISFFSPDGAYVVGIIENLKFSLSSNSSDLIEVEILARTINYQTKTQAILLPINNNPDGIDTDYVAKALFQGEKNFKVEIRYVAGTRYYVENVQSNVATLGSDLLFSGNITQTTDKYRTGGTKLFLRSIYAVPNDRDLVELRVYEQPQKIIFKNISYTPLYSNNGYWYVNTFKHNGDVLNTFKTDFDTFWIIF